MLNDARSKAEIVDRQSRDKAASLEREAARKHAEVIGSLSQEKRSLEKKLDELRTFERAYRTRLTTYLESQLRQLIGRGSVAPADPIRDQQGRHGPRSRRTCHSGVANNRKSISTPGRVNRP
jgi:hypothetical protein